jgi:hypothetical protein
VIPQGEARWSARVRCAAFAYREIAEQQDPDDRSSRLSTGKRRNGCSLMVRARCSESLPSKQYFACAGITSRTRVSGFLAPAPPRAAMSRSVTMPTRRYPNIG